MFTIALDEFGKFEVECTIGSTPLGIGGLLYDDGGDASDFANEKLRIRKFYEKCIAEAGTGATNPGDFVYPEALHANEIKSRDASVVKPTKSAVARYLGEFLREGTVNGQQLLRPGEERKGAYYICANAKSNRGVELLLGENVNSLVCDNKGGNLYAHMASDLICRVLFHNPVATNINEVTFHIATRRTEDMDPLSERGTQFIWQGYHQNPGRDNLVNFSVANPDIYRSVLSREIIRSGKESVRIRQYSVKSIVYAANARDMEFLYMADSLCSYLSYGITVDEQEKWFEKVEAKANTINPKDRNLIFAYDEIDVRFQRAWTAYENGDYYQALSYCYGIQKREGTLAQYYQKKWFAKLRERITAEVNEQRYANAVRTLHSTTTTNNLDPELSRYILEILLAMTPQVVEKMDDTESKAVAYLLYDTAMTIYCHYGDFDKVFEYYEACKQYRSAIGIEESLNTLNKLSESLLDHFEWERALEVAEEAIRLGQAMIQLRQSLDFYREEEEGSSYALAKAYSQKGQVLAFMEMPECVEWFQKAMAIYEKTSANYRITQSYLMQYYLEQRDSEKYASEAETYFNGERKARGRFDYIMKEAFVPTPIINHRYALFLFLKSIVVFETELSDSLYQKLMKLEEEIGKSYRREKGKKAEPYSGLHGHPAEMLYKYIAVIAAMHGDIEQAEANRQKMKNCLSYQSEILDLILADGEARIDAALQGTEHQGDARLTFMYH